MNEASKEEASVSGFAAPSNPASLNARQDCSVACAPQSAEEDELSVFLSLLDCDSHYCVERTLKQSDAEVTQLVTFVAENGTEQGPFIRKYLMAGQGVGSAYAEIFRAQQ